MRQSHDPDHIGKTSIGTGDVNYRPTSPVVKSGNQTSRVKISTGKPRIAPSVIRFIFPALMHESSLTAAHLFSPTPIRQVADTFAPAAGLHNDPPKRLFFPLPYDSVKTNTFLRHVHALLLPRPLASDAQAVSHFVKTVCPKTSGKTLHWNVSLHNRLFLFHTD